MGDIISRQNMQIVPISLKEAQDFINRLHRHHTAPVGHKFSIGAKANGVLVGVCVVGRPVSRYMDDGKTLEVTRLCTDGTKNACSFLYGRAARIAEDMGYTKIITYILETENGASLKASNWHCEEAETGGGNWSCQSRPREIEITQLSFLPGKEKKYPTCKKQRWAKDL